VAKLPKELVRVVAHAARAWPGGVFADALHAKGMTRMTGAVRVVAGGFALVQS
jgi:hypothetical protein